MFHGRLFFLVSQLRKLKEFERVESGSVTARVIIDFEQPVIILLQYINTSYCWRLCFGGKYKQIYTTMILAGLPKGTWFWCEKVLNWTLHYHCNGLPTVFVVSICICHVTFSCIFAFNMGCGNGKISPPTTEFTTTETSKSCKYFIQWWSFVVNRILTLNNTW